MHPITDSKYWEQQYQEGTTRWDLAQAAPPFVSLLNLPTAPLSPGKAAILGCGRGYDALLFAGHGFKVVGFDFAPSAIDAARSLAAEAGISTQFLQRDIFTLANEFPQYFDYVVEHTCFCAIAPEQRPDYVQLVRSLLKPKGELIGLFWAHNRPGGPPFGATLTEISSCFEPYFEINSLNLVTNSVSGREGEEYLGRFRLK